MSTADLTNKIPGQLKSLKLIPLKCKSKEPLVKWATDETFNLEEYNNITSYGVDTGRSGLVVIDCDSKNDVDGVGAFFELIASNEDLPDTLVVETPNDGMHYYFTSKNKDIKNSASTTLGRGIDVRANGGYVVGPGSIIIDEEGNEKEYTLFNEDFSNIAPLPVWLEAMLTKDRKAESTKIKTTSNESVTPLTNDEKTVNKKNALNWALIKMNNAIEGEREETLNRLSFFMGVVRVDETEARELISIAIQKGLTNKEATLKFEHGYTDGLKEEEQYFENVIKQYNTMTNTSFKDDPMDTGYYSHLALSYNFYNNYSTDFIYWGTHWYQYIEEEGRWCKVEETAVMEKVDKFVESLVIKIRKDNPKLPSNIYKLQEKLWLKTYIESITIVARRRFINNQKNLFDPDNHLINCKNGVIDLRSGEILPHSRDYYITRYIPIPYEPDAKDDYCDMILQSIDSPEKEYLQLMAGQSLTGEQNRSQVAIFLHGRGSNGKSTFIDLMLKTSGDYSALQPPTVLAEEKQGGDKYALADFEGLRCAIIEELPDNKTLSSSALKRIVGTQRINSRKIYSSYREFINQSSVFVSCNKLPMVTDTDDGTWRRLLVINFKYSYKKNKSDIKGSFDRLANPRVLNAAQNKRDTAKAFFAWRVAGAIRWYREPRAEFNVPESIVEASETWRENNDLLRAWANSNVEKALNHVCLIEDLRASFNQFVTERGHNEVTQRYFVEMLTNHSFYYDNNLIHKRNARINKIMIHSEPKNIRDYEPKKILGSNNIILGLKFKN